MYITKASGEKVKFDSNKISHTLKDAGASESLTKEILQEVNKKYKKKGDLKTEDILNLVLHLLQRTKPEIAAKYDLKRAIMSLGPSGFPFEAYFATILENYGYKVKVGQILKGKKINHEIDIVAKNNKNYMIECKYHNSTGITTRIKVAMYTYARFLDLKIKLDHPWLATNTKCSLDVINYAKGVGMKITSWKYPEKDNLKQLIEKKGLYPITLLRLINNDSKEKLYKANIMLVKDLAKHKIEELEIKTGLSIPVLKKILEEARNIYSFKE